MTPAWRESCAAALGWMRKGIASVSGLPWQLLAPVSAIVASMCRTCPVTRMLQGWVSDDSSEGNSNRKTKLPAAEGHALSFFCREIPGVFVFVSPHCG